MKRSTILWLSPFAVLLGLAVWMLALLLVGDPRVSDGRLSGDEMSWFESAAFTYAMFGVIIAWIISVVRALAANRYGWAAAIFIVWPLAAVFIWREGKQPIQPAETTLGK